MKTWVNWAFLGKKSPVSRTFLMKSCKISRVTYDRMASKIRPCLLKLCYWMYIYVHVSKFNWAVWLWLAVSPSKADLVKNCGPIGVAFRFHLTRGAAFSWFCRFISIGEWKLCWSVPLSIFLMESLLRQTYLPRPFCQLSLLGRSGTRPCVVCTISYIP